MMLILISNGPSREIKIYIHIIETLKIRICIRERNLIIVFKNLFKDQKQKEKVTRKKPRKTVNLLRKRNQKKK